MGRCFTYKALNYHPRIQKPQKILDFIHISFRRPGHNLSIQIILGHSGPSRNVEIMYLDPLAPHLVQSLGCFYKVFSLFSRKTYDHMGADLYPSLMKALCTCYVITQSMASIYSFQCLIRSALQAKLHPHFPFRCYILSQ